MNRLLVGLVLAGLAGLVGCGAGDPNMSAPSTPSRPGPSRPPP
jgi:hypothetical protein